MLYTYKNILSGQTEDLVDTLWSFPVPDSGALKIPYIIILS